VINLKNKKFSILPIFFTVFLDLLGLGIVIPILPAVLLDPRSAVLPFSYDFSTRTLIYGFLIASYPLAQFFGAPILGTLADQKGRKKLLTVSLIGTLAGYVLFALGIIYNNIYLLFIGRTAGSMGITIPRPSKSKNTVKNIGNMENFLFFKFITPL